MKTKIQLIAELTSLDPNKVIIAIKAENVPWVKDPRYPDMVGLDLDNCTEEQLQRLIERAKNE
jgi:hypothetical protein